MKKNLMYFTIVMLITAVIEYVAIGFIRWEFDWVKHIVDLTNESRMWIFAGIIIKILIDVWLWSWFKSAYVDKPEDREDIFKNVITEKTEK